MDSTGSPADSALCPTCSQAYRESDDALKRANSLLLAALEAAADGILVVDLEGRTVARSTRFVEMCGLPPDCDDEPLRHMLLDRIEDRDHFAARLAALRADPAATSEDTVRLRDGRAFECRSQPQRLDGRVVGRVWSFRDVTARVRAEEELRSRERQLAETQRLARLGSWRWDVPENRVTWSDELYRIYGLDPATFGATFEAYLARVHSDDVADVQARLQTALAEGGRLDFEERIVRPDGEVRVLRSQCEIMLDAAGRPLRVVGACHDITEQRAAEDARRLAAEALAASELALQAANEALEVRVAERTAELETVFQALPDAYFRLDAHGTVLDHRPGVVPTGVPGGERVAGRSLEELCQPAAAAQLRQAVDTVRRTGELVCVDIADATGSRDLEARVVPFNDDQAIAIVRDVTDSRQSARELQRSEEHFRTLIENGSDLIILVDDEGRTTYLSPSAERLLGWPPAQRLGRSSFEMLHPDDVPAVAARRQEAIDSPGRPVPVEFRYHHGDGSWRTFEAFVRTLSPDSATGGLVVNARDVTARKTIEAELQRSEQYFRTLIDNASDLITIVDADGTIRYESAAITRLFGYAQDELLGHSAFELIHPDDAPAAAAALSELIATPGVARAVEFRFRAADGSWRVLESVGQTVNPTSAQDGVVVNSRDIGERRAAQDALERARAEAEQANRAKSEFLSRMSHELRTPMNSILGFAQLLAKRAANEDQTRSIDHILRAGRHLLNLINEVLDISRIEANRHHLSLEPVRIDGAVQDAITLIRPLAAQYDCEVDEPGPLPDNYVRADRQRLAQVLLNLLSNAVKYNRPGGHVRVTVEPAPPEDGERGSGRWQIAVHDTGRGIPAHRMEELFIPFSRLGADLSQVEGTGLGLALSQRLVEAMGGRLDVQSTVDEGSTFTVVLCGAASPLDRGDLRVAAPRPAPGVVQPATLLYIEDNLANLALVETILEGRPEITLVPALQGRLGLDLARQHAPDLILLDLHLPDIPGDEVLVRLRADLATRRIPVIVISADATPRRIERLRADGVFAYLTKPLDVDVFLDAVDAALERRGA